MMTQNKLKRESILAFSVASVIVASAAHQVSAVLYLYEPFSYTAGDSLGGAGGSATGQAGTYVGGGSYNWYARGTGGSAVHDPVKDAVVSSGNLSYAGLAPSLGNSVSYGSALPNPANDAFHKSLYGDTVALPVTVNTGSLYASFIVRIKSEVENGAGTADRHAPAGFVTAESTAALAGTSISGVQSGSAVAMGSFWMRRDPVDLALNRSNFGVGKTSGDGIGPGTAAAGDNAGWQNSDPNLPPATEANQFGDLDGQPEAIFSDANTWQTYFVVLKYEFNFSNTSADDYDAPGSTPSVHGQNHTVSLWMNPNAATLGVANGEILASANPSASAGSYYAATDAYGSGTPDIDTVAIPNSIKSFALLGHRQTTNETFALDFDELRIGTTWLDVTPTAAPGIPGDFNSDGKVDAGDYATWRKNNGTSNALANDNGLGTPIGSAHYNLWRANFGKPPGAGSGAGLGTRSVPEPNSMLLAIGSAISMVLALCGRQCSSR